MINPGLGTRSGGWQDYLELQQNLLAQKSTAALGLAHSSGLPPFLMLPGKTDTVGVVKDSEVCL